MFIRAYKKIFGIYFYLGIASYGLKECVTKVKEELIDITLETQRKESIFKSKNFRLLKKSFLIVLWFSVVMGLGYIAIISMNTILTSILLFILGVGIVFSAMKVKV